MRTKQRSSQCRVPRASLLLTLTTIILFSCSQQILAQQRDEDATNADSNTSSASTGRVNFNIIQLMNGEYLEMFGTGTSRGILRGHSSIAGIELGSLSADPLMFSTNSIERIRILANGFIGIGVTTPAVPLDVSGNAINLGSDIGGANRSNNTIKLSRLSIPPFTTPRLNFAYVAAATTNTDNIAAIGGAAGGFSAATVVVFHTAANPNTDTGTERMRIDSAGNVGIGTTAPAYKLDVVSSSNLISRFGSNASQHSQLLIDSQPAFNSNLTLQRGGTPKWYIGNRASNDRLSFIEATGSVELLAVLQNGNVGIGTVSPTEKLEVLGSIKVSGNIASGGLCIAGVCKTAWSQVGAVSSVFGRTGAVVAQAGDYTWMQINKSTSSLADIATRNAGDLSSGTLPDARFPTTLPAVSGANLTALNASNLAIGTVPIARLGSGTADSTKFLRGDNTWAVASGSLQWTTSGTSISYNSGNVGIGTANPTAKLEVIGDIKVSGNINAKYQDVAEWVDSSQELVAGTVVVLDSSRSNHVIAATQSYDSRIAGVISLQPGLTLGEKAEGRVLVATTGRVRVKVDATEGAIQIGDLLVTSNREGFAMKSLPVDVGRVQIHRPGTLIGKALEPLAKGTGEILVLLSLQ